MKKDVIRSHAIKLRSEGKTFQEINDTMKINVPKSTMSTWFRGIILPVGARENIEKTRKEKLRGAQKLAVIVARNKRVQAYQEFLHRNTNLQELCDRDDIAKVVLASLYLCEGTKNKRSALVFGNSDPFIVSLFLKLLRQVFVIDEKKFRCTLQGRGDQNIEKLEIFWSEVTKIPRTQFYSARIDPRTKGKRSLKVDYNGVCRIDYLSASVFHEIMAMCEIITRRS